MDEDIKHFSEVVYAALCGIIGDEDLIKFNRLCCAISDLSIVLVKEEISENPTLILKRINPLFSGDVPTVMSEVAEAESFISGSRAEGFNFESSDFDMMSVIKSMKVIQNQFQNYDCESSHVLMVDKSNTSPGFVRIKQRSRYQWFPDRDYQSHSMVLQFLCEMMKRCCYNSDFDRHGPCVNVAKLRQGEHEATIALPSDTWPLEAVACLHRLLKRRWPSVDTIRKMVKDGTLFVPIGCKTSPNEDVEWRMSFSLAEKRLVHSMNHTQFLTYALLKLFMKEVVDEEADLKGLLCSYFMKTLVFWEIIESNIPWTSCYFIQHFWNCFRRLLCWINKEYCPNFFLPENNMFRGKIYGRRKQKLLRFLCMLYRKGYLVVQDIPSLQRCSSQQRFHHGLTRSYAIQMLNFHSYMKFNRSSGRIYETLESSQLDVALEYSQYLNLTHLNLCCYRILSSLCSIVCINRGRYLKEKSLFRLLKVSSPDTIRSKIFLAVTMYRSKRYDRCISQLLKVLSNLEEFGRMRNFRFNLYIYSDLEDDSLTISTRMKRFAALCVPLDSETCIPEISAECSTSTIDIEFHYIDPVVLTHFLLFLCYFWKKDSRVARIHITDIFNYLKARRNDKGIVHIMSWEILGIAQEIIGDFEHALMSFGEFERRAYADQDLPRLRFLLEVSKARSMRIRAFFNME